MIRFNRIDHTYLSTDPGKLVDWIGVTSFVDFFKPRFDPISSSIKASKNQRSKWYGLTPEAIRDIWKRESSRSLNMGVWYHNKTETSILSSPRFKQNGSDLTVMKPIYVGEEKHASSQVLSNNSVYPEHLAYSLSEGICGQTDRVEVIDHRINVRDYKTSKAIKTEGFTNWEGMTARMSDPLSHLDDCNFIHYTLQLSVYLYIILKHNPQFIPGDLILEHIIFEQDSTDTYGYPVYRTTPDGDYIIKEIKPYKVSYLKSEVTIMLDFLRENRELVKSTIETNKSK